MGSNRTGKKSLDRMARDPRIEEIWTEDDGYCDHPTGRECQRPTYWALLAHGYNREGVSCLHSCTIKGLYRQLEDVTEGDTY